MIGADGDHQGLEVDDDRRGTRSRLDGLSKQAVSRGRRAAADRQVVGALAELSLKDIGGNTLFDKAVSKAEDFGPRRLVEHCSRKSMIRRP